MSGDGRVPFDLDAYEREVVARNERGACFICEVVAGERDDHAVVFRDDIAIAFLAKYPTLRGYCLVAPLEHRREVVGDFTEDEFAAFQRRLHRVGRAVSAALPTERLYLLSLGSRQANDHVHWHVAPLPPGVPYREQQYAALMHEHGYLDLDTAGLEAIADQIRHALETDGR
jgi:diadenosine tetraphosphate (Ap4A) HIT family hydrolase